MAGAEPGVVRLQRVILACRGVRSLTVGVLQVALPLALEKDGVGTVGIHAVLSAGIAGSASALAFLGPCSSRLGRQGALAILTATMALASCVVAWSQSIPLLLVAAFAGVLSMQPNLAPQAPLEHATLADLAGGKDARTAVFAWYNGISTVAIALGSGAVGIPCPGGVHVQISAVALLLLAASAAYMLRGGGSGAAVAAKEEDLLPAKERSLADCVHARRIMAMAVLFSVDAFAGAMALNSVLTHWFSTQYGSGGGLLGPLFAAGALLSAGSLPVAVRLTTRIGLVPTMVFTHLPSNLCLAVMPFMPSEGLVYALFLLRAATSQMDVPARESFTMSVVDAEERVACSSAITFARTAASVFGPPAGAALWRLLGPAAPLVVAGALKCAYDLTLLGTFRSLATK